MRIIIGSRGSQLALWQANWVKDRLVSGGCEVEIRIIKTAGDKLQDVPLAQSGLKGLFIKEIEEALAEGTIDLAVHSLKDLPTDQPPGLVLASVPEREDVRDVLISKDGARFAALPPKARVGTSSLRRQSQLRKLRNDLEFLSLRGNLDTRLKKLDRGDCDAIVLAAAGVHRLGFRARITEYFSPAELCPAVGQGALALETRDGDDRTRQSDLRLTGVVASLDGSTVIRATAAGVPDAPESLGAKVAEALLEQGAKAILDSIKL
jgi:hydroxymethylbilane synthase